MRRTPDDFRGRPSPQVAAVWQLRAPLPGMASE